MPDLKITILGLNEALAALGKVQADVVPVAAKAAALATIASAKPYPAQSHKRQPFVSAAQRRAFFAKLKSGAISVPYQRTGALQDAWTFDVDAGGADVTNPSPHAAYTYAPQAAYHKGNWPNEETLAKRAEPAARDAAEQAIVGLIAGVS